MCQYSLHSHPDRMRKAKVNETLTRGNYSQHACFYGGDGKLTCIKPGTTLSIERFDVERGVNRKFFEDLLGKTIRVTFYEANSGRYGRWLASDMVKLPDGRTLPFHMLREGLVARIPRKVRKDKGVAKPRNLVKLLALDQVRAEVAIPVKVSAR